MSLILCPLHTAARRWSDAIAVSGPEGDLSYEALDARVGALVLHLRSQGVREGDHLGYIGQNHLEAILLLYAAMRLGAVFAPLSPRFPEAQRDALIKELDIRWCWSEGELPQGVRALSFTSASVGQSWQVDLNRPLTLILTSGSSGHPKAAMHTLAQHMAAAEGSHDQTPLHRGDRWLLSLPLFHIGGLAILFRCLSCGATAVLPGHQDMASNLKQQRITHLSLVATQLVRLLDRNDAGEVLASVTTLLLGGGAIPTHLLERLKPYPIKVLTSYGMTEMGSQITTGPANDQGLSGTPLAGRQVRINDGLIEVRGDCRFLGYYANGTLSRPFDSEGWFATRDRGQFIGEQLKVLGRADNMFVSGGENVQPEAIEAVLKRCEGVEEAIVIPIANEEFGHLPVAVVKGAWAPELWEKRVLKKLPRFMRPRHYLPWPDNLAQMGLKVSRKAIAEFVQTQSLSESNP
ncbi:o-succinylbenzoate--CoA ligase [Ferrimonas balearica]|uniref:o-succinylbenzoate--CoA ligase n=1 Tax=Ferrimonas balearica TaxID=44012 RepID=UPI001C99F158|nr:o-succinylbenzoate--CoA ligase [Ferrimonas balearica]MBY5923243.1 o-succinylbenzoate--CoA ligase [Ferrimonas balearica]MBY5995201.1 o-succinylbenzoate--CoA ligase [Ferrimonas balearica]